MPLIVCRLCGTGYASIGEVPPVCPACEQETTWTTVPSGYAAPKPDYKLTLNDMRFLRSMKILADEPKG